MLIRKRRKNMLILICSSILAVFSLAFFFKFLKADGDLTLMSRKQVKREEIEDKVVWITGASRGIGEVLARQVASFGAKLIISARNEVELERVKKNLTGKHAPDEVMILPLDLSQGEEHLREAVQKAESCFGDAGVDYMFHNAAYERPKTTALDVTEESLKATFDVNVLGPISLTRLLAPHMLKRGSGHFVVMSSAAGKAPAPGQAVYSASKFAVNGYFHTLRSELYTRGIKVTVVYPGPVMTSTSEKSSSEKRVSSERCAELTIIAATHGLKEAWISHQRDKRRRKQEEKTSGLESDSDFDLILDLEGPDWNGVNQGYVWVVFILFVIFTRWAIIFLRLAHPVLAVMYLMQYIPTVGYWLMDKIGAKRVETAAQKGNTYSINLLFGKNKAQ